MNTNVKDESVGPVRLPGTDVNVEMQLEKVHDSSYLEDSQDRICDITFGHDCGLVTTVPMMESSVRHLANWILDNTNDVYVNASTNKRINYNVAEINSALKFIIDHNPSAKVIHSVSREWLLNLAVQCVNANNWFISTAGVTVLVGDTYEYEGYRNYDVEFLVDPALGQKTWDDEEFKQIIL